MTAADTTPKVFEQTVARQPERVALRQKTFGLWRYMSWQTYFDQVRQIGSALIAMGLQPGECVGIIGDNCPEWVLADMAVQCAGGVSVGIYATNAWQQVQFIVDHAETTFLFVENEEQLDKWLMFRDQAPSLRKVIVWDLEGLQQFEDPLVMTFEALQETGRQAVKDAPEALPRRMQQVKPDDLSVLIYTSGTTGPPKGAMLTHRNVTWMARAVTHDNPIHRSDEVLSFLPLCHIFERLFSVFAHITHGYVVNFVEKPDTVTDNMVEVSPTVGYAVPRIWEKLQQVVLAHLVSLEELEAAKASGDVEAVSQKVKSFLGLEDTEYILTSTAPTPAPLKAWYADLGIVLYDGYGQSEILPVCGNQPDDRKIDSIGVAAEGVEIKIAEDGIMVNIRTGAPAEPDGGRRRIVGLRPGARSSSSISLAR